MELTAAVLAGFVLAPLAPVVQRAVGDRSGWITALAPALLAGFFLARLPAVADGAVLLETLAWVPTLDVAFSFRLDGLSLVFALLVTGVGALVQVYTGGYMAGKEHAGRQKGLLLAFMAAMLGLVLADDLVAVFVFWELTSLLSFLLVGFNHGREDVRSAALQALAVTVAGGLALLGGLVILGHVGGTFRLSELVTMGETVRAHPWYAAAFGLVFVGAAAKSAQFPLHFWLPSAMAAPTPVSAYLHSATMVKAGVYLLARLSPVLGGTTLWTTTLIGVGATTMLLGAYLALGPTDYKQVLAYSTISALGTLVLLLGVGSPAAIEAAIVLLFAHGLYKGALFMVAGAVEHETGTRSLDQLRGLRQAMPITALVAGLAALSLAGLGPLLSFIGKELFFDVLLANTLARPFLLAAGLLTSMMLVAAAGIVGLRPFTGETKPTPREPEEPTAALVVGPAILAAAGLVLGFVPSVLNELLVPEAARAILGVPEPVKLSLWHGVTPALGLTAVAIVGGFAIYQGWEHLHRVRGRISQRLPFSGQRVYDAAMLGLQRGAYGFTRRVQSGRLRTYLLVVLGVAGALLAASLIPGGLPAWPTIGEMGAVAGALAALIAVGAGLTALSTSRLTAIVGVGLTGYGAALVFVLYSAPDLAMTQVLFETLSVIVFLLVLRNLPDLDYATSEATRLRDGLLALGIGAGVSLALVLAADAGEGSRLTGFFAEHSYLLAHGRNVVNTILVDFRALDTLGEITVLATAGAGVYALLDIGSDDEGGGDGA